VISDVGIPLSLSFPPAAGATSSPTRAGGRELALRIGFDMQLEMAGPQPTALLLMLDVHPDAARQLDGPPPRIDVTHLGVAPSMTLTSSAPSLLPEPTPLLEPTRLAVEVFTDGFGNRCARVVAPPGMLRLAYDATFRCAYAPEPQPDPTAKQHPAGELASDVLPFLLGSRYCEVDRLSAVAWDLFGRTAPGGARALAVNEWVFKHIHFSYKLTRPNKTALDTYVERNGVCRDMMHLAVTFCRALNIPSRYATGYLGDIDADPDPTPMDFSAFYEVYLDGRWWPMDARHGKPRVGRGPSGRGRDATDVALITSFGRHRLAKFTVVTEEIAAPVEPLLVMSAPPPVAPAPLALSA
jgi:transglutaminase-like putative cysteine protease